MSPRKGRPKVDEPKDIRFSIRIDDDTNKKLDDYCEKNGITKAEAIRKGIHLLLSQKNRALPPWKSSKRSINEEYPLKIL